MLVNKYNSNYRIIQEGCITEMQNRIGYDLRVHKSKTKRKQFSDEKTVLGRGCLIDTVVDSIQTYYEKAT